MQNYVIVNKEKFSNRDHIIYTVQIGNSVFVDVIYDVSINSLTFAMENEVCPRVYTSEGQNINYSFNETAVIALVKNAVEKETKQQTKYAVISVYTGYSHGFGMPQVEYFDDESKAVERLKKCYNKVVNDQLAWNEDDPQPFRSNNSKDWHAARLWYPTADIDVEDDYFSVWVVPVRD